MTRRKPTSPSNITPDMIAKALSKQDRERYRATLERAGIPEDVIETSLDSGAITVVAASIRLLSVRANAAQQSIPARKGASVAGSTPERAQHARDGLEAEPVSHNSGHEIARVRAPFALSGARIDRATSELTSTPQRGRGRPSRFEKCLDHSEGPNLRWAFSRYIEDYDLVEGRSKCGGVPHAAESNGRQGGLLQLGGSAPGSRLPITPNQQDALDRIAIVNKMLTPRERGAARDLVETFLPVNPHAEHLSMRDYAAMKSGINGDEARDGFYIGYFWGLGEKLFDIYRIPRLARSFLGLSI